jgi:quercetin 2,3-dioxygenase
MIKSMPTLEGAGVYLRRAFGFGNPKEFDPVLLSDDLPNSTASIVGNLPASKH